MDCEDCDLGALFDSNGARHKIVSKGIVVRALESVWPSERRADRLVKGAGKERR